MKKQEQGWIFFDIDGTLLHAHSAGREAFRLAFKKALDWDENVQHISFCGATDLAVFRSICKERGVRSSPEAETLFFNVLAEELDKQLKKKPPEVFPAVEKTLSILSKGWKKGIHYGAIQSTSWRKHAIPHLAKPLRMKKYLSLDSKGSTHWKLGVITGNIKATAHQKLKHTNLLPFFDRTGMGFGCDHSDRSEIARLALKRAGSPRRSVLIGDTPEDIRAAKDNDMLSIIVATGAFDIPTLTASGADFVFKNLQDTHRLLSILTQFRTDLPPIVEPPKPADPMHALFEPVKN